jgi:membrane protein
MARLSEAKQVLHALGFKEFARRVWQQVGEDDVLTWAASLAYSWIFALFPFLIFLLALVPLMPANARAEVESDMDAPLKVLSKNAAAPIEQQVHLLVHQPRRALLSIGLLITIWAASNGMSMTMSALDRCYDIKEGRPYIQHRFVAILLTIVAATQVILVMVLMPIASGIIAWLDSHGKVLGPILLLLNFFRFAFAILLMLGLLALVYHWGVSIKIKFHFLTPGALFSIAVWLILAFAFRFYINRFGEASYNKTYGAVAGVAILLLFFYIDASVLLIGAEINSEVDFAILGLPSFDNVKVQSFERHHTQEHRELLRELMDKRDVPIAEPTGASTKAPPAPMRSTGTNGTLKAVSLLATAAATWVFFKALREARQASLEKERLKQLYPATFQALAQKPAHQSNAQPRRYVS